MSKAASLAPRLRAARADWKPDYKYLTPDDVKNMQTPPSITREMRILSPLFSATVNKDTHAQPASCPKCKSEYTYEDGVLLICPECGHEWTQSEASNVNEERVWKDTNGTLLQDGDTVTVIKDLKVKGASSVLKGDESQKHPPCRR